MNYCLNIDELKYLLLLHLENKTVGDVNLRTIFTNAEQWQDKVLCLTYSLARILEKRGDLAKLSPKTIISTLFSMPDNMFIDIQECGEDFVDYMLRNEHSGIKDLELSLISVAKELSEHCYGKETLRS